MRIPALLPLLAIGASLHNVIRIWAVPSCLRGVRIAPYNRTTFVRSCFVGSLLTCIPYQCTQATLWDTNTLCPLGLYLPYLKHEERHPLRFGIAPLRFGWALGAFRQGYNIGRYAFPVQVLF